MDPPPVCCGQEQKGYAIFGIRVKLFKIREKLVDKRRERVIYYPSTTGRNASFGPKKTFMETKKVLDKAIPLWYYQQAAAEKVGA